MNRILLSLALLSFCIQTSAQDAPPAFPWVELPDGAVAKAWAGVGEDTVPAQFGEDFPTEKLKAGDAWSSSETWLLWSEWLTSQDAETSVEKAAARRAGLAWLALEQGRNEDAWRHFTACANAPEWMALLMPRFLPGTPPEYAPGAAGRPEELPDAVLFTPCIPSMPPSPSGVLLAREATIRDLVVDGARFDMKVLFDSYGVQLDFEWKSGGPANLLVLIPEPDGYKIRVEYLDWIRQDEKRVPMLVELSEQTPQVSLFARILSTQSLWPGSGTGGVPAEMRRAGLWLEHDSGESELELLRAVAQAAARVLGLEVRVRESGTQPADNKPRGVVLRVPPPGPERQRKLAWLASTLERYALKPAQAGK